MLGAERQMAAALTQRKDRGTLRGLSTRIIAAADGAQRLLVDFSSNDYLGMARDTSLMQAVRDEEGRAQELNGSSALLGSTGSRLLTGNNVYAEQLEAHIAQCHNREASLLFTSGYTANLGVVASVPGKGDVVLYDELCHNSLIEGFKLGRQSASIRFKHNSAKEAAKALASLPELRPESQSKANVFIIVESVYSMDGDIAPIRDLLELCGTYPEGRVCLVVDEAHASGVFGDTGMGVVSELGLESHPNLLCTVHTYGKGFGVHGAAVVGSAVLKEYLINYARTLVYTTALPLHGLASIRCAYSAVEAAVPQREHLRGMIRLFRDRMAGPALLPSPSPIQAVLLPGNMQVVAAAKRIREQGFDVLAIRAPTVPAGTERLRVILHAHNTAEDVRRLTEVLRSLVANAAKL